MTLRDLDDDLPGFKHNEQLLRQLERGDRKRQQRADLIDQLRSLNGSATDEQLEGLADIISLKDLQPSREREKLEQLDSLIDARAQLWSGKQFPGLAGSYANDFEEYLLQEPAIVQACDGMTSKLRASIRRMIRRKPRPVLASDGDGESNADIRDTGLADTNALLRSTLRKDQEEELQTQLRINAFTRLLRETLGLELSPELIDQTETLIKNKAISEFCGGDEMDLIGLLTGALLKEYLNRKA